MEHKLSITNKWIDQAENLIWHFIRKEFIKKTSFPSSVKSLGYIKYLTLRNLRSTYANKIKQAITSLYYFWRIANSVQQKVTKVKQRYLLYLMEMRCYLLLLIKQNCLHETFLRTSILMTQVSLPVFSSKTNLKLQGGWEVG